MFCFVLFSSWAYCHLQQKQGTNSKDERENSYWPNNWQSLHSFLGKITFYFTIMSANQWLFSSCKNNKGASQNDPMFFLTSSLVSFPPLPSTPATVVSLLFLKISLDILHWLFSFALALLCLQHFPDRHRAHPRILSGICLRVTLSNHFN